MATPDLPERLAQYVAARTQQRGATVERTLAAMTERERRLVREAAVMGWVQGARSVPGARNVTVPPDRDIVYRVVDGCLAFDDLYPVINSLA